jgi:hypothetical protein
LARAGRTFPRLNTLRYKPRVSVEVNDGRVQFFEHSKRSTEPPLRVVVPLIPEWLLFWLLFWLRWAGRWIRWPFLALIWRLRHKHRRFVQ